MKMLSDITEVELEEIFDSLNVVIFEKADFEYYKDNGESLTGLGEEPIGILITCFVDHLKVKVHLDLLDAQSTAYYDDDRLLHAYFPWVSFIAELYKRGYLTNIFKRV